MFKPNQQLSPGFLTVYVVITILMAVVFTFYSTGFQLAQWDWTVFGRELLFFSGIGAIGLLFLIFRKRN
jgi:hypothetical protein